jgi:septal ring-binding cell division protein DamX
MAEGDGKRAGETKDDLKKAKSEVGVSSHDDMGVRVTRDLNAGGSVARGYSSSMSKMNFSSRGMPREEVADDEDQAPAKPVAAAPVQTPAPAATPASPAEPASGGALSWLTGLFKRR